MLQGMTSRQLSEWMAFYRLEPFGFEAEMYGHAITSSVVANVNKKRGRKAFTPLDFMPKERALPSVKDFFANLKTVLMLNQRNKRQSKRKENK